MSGGEGRRRRQSGPGRRRHRGPGERRQRGGQQPWRGGEDDQQERDHAGDAGGQEDQGGRSGVLHSVVSRIAVHAGQAQEYEGGEGLQTRDPEWGKRTGEWCGIAGQDF